MEALPPNRPANEPLVYIVILNWNGYADTIECLESLRRLEHRRYVAIVLDNGSPNDSVARITAWAGQTRRAADGAPPFALELVRRMADGNVERGDGIAPALNEDARRLLLVDNGENLGFAAGSNVGIRLALAQTGDRRADYVWLLNNDTVVEPESLTRLIACMDAHPEFAALTPQIRLAGNPDKVWNCGGFLTWNASRRYLYGGQSVLRVPTQGCRRITFATGCALLLRRALLDEIGVLSECFFFGEEDYEFSRRMRKRKRSMGCCFEAIIYHKVGATARTAMPTESTGRIHLHYLNRFIHMRNEWPRFWWQLWRLASALYILPMLRFRFGVPFGRSRVLFRDVLHESATLKSVDRATFERIMTSAATVEKESG